MKRATHRGEIFHTFYLNPVMQAKRTTDDYFPNLKLFSPQATQGGAYIAKLVLGDDAPLRVQLPRCTTKRGIVTTRSGQYTDLCFDAAANQQLIDWSLSLEARCIDMVYEKRRTWFSDEMGRDDIEAMLCPVSRLFRAGSKVLIRTSIPTGRRASSPVSVYNERQDLLDLDHIQESTILIPLVNISGIKFTSRSFELEIKLVQVMVMDEHPSPSNVCMIEPPSTDLPPSVNLQTPERAPPDDVGSEHKPSEVPVTPSAGSSEAPTPPPACAPLETPIDAPSNENADAAAPSEPAKQASESPTAHVQKVDAPAEGTVDSCSDVSSDNEAEDIVEGALEEVDITPGPSEMSLKDPKEVYATLYKAARLRAKDLKRRAAEALIETKRLRRKIQDNEWAIVDSSESDSDAEADSVPGYPSG